MKTKLAFLALSFVLTFGMIANVSAAITASTGISLTAISLSDARYGNTTGNIIVSTNPGQIYLSFRITDGASEYITLNSVLVQVTVNGNAVFDENLTSYDLGGGAWNKVGFYGLNSYVSGSMNQGPILVGWGNLNSSSAYNTTINPGDVWQAKMTYDVQGQGVFTSVGTMTYVPEPSTAGLIILSTFCFLRRKRK